MHIGITMTMNIRFDAYVLELLIIGYSWDQLIDKYQSQLPRFRKLAALSSS